MGFFVNLRWRYQLVMSLTAFFVRLVCSFFFSLILFLLLTLLTACLNKQSDSKEPTILTDQILLYH